MNPGSNDVIVVGGGLIGLATAWRLVQQGLRVQVVERSRDSAAAGSASEAAGGMLAPSAELQFEEVDLYRFQRESADRWPAFARELEAAAGMSVDYRDEGTLMVAADRDDAEAYRRLYRFQRESGVPVEWLTPSDALDLEPFLSPRIAGAIHAPGDHGVDNHLVLEALRRVLAGSGSAEVLFGDEVVAVEPDGDQPAVRTASGRRLAARAVILAAGAWIRAVEGLPRPVPVRPVKGQMLSLAMEAPFGLRHIIRTPRGYLVPKSSGKLVVGATSEEMGFDTRVTGGGLYRLLENAVEVVPGVEELELIDSWAGLRPASRDHRPLLGFGFAPGIALATGHFRHGVLLTAITADELAEDVIAQLGGRSPSSEWLRPFSPARLSAEAGTKAGVTG
jgi:glycine oxidase